MPRLKSVDVINDPARNSSVDVFRALAIIAVVLHHFNFRLPFGYIGVDLFFVISGLLVGGLLTKEFREQRRISYPRFILQRGFKIWPSYYFFLIAGNILVYLMERDHNPDQYIRLSEYPPYLLFYWNYAAVPFRLSFGHIWSLCVEEHFYLVLPLLFIIVQHFVAPKHRLKTLFAFIILTIFAGLVLKFFSLHFMNSKDTVIASHNRVDAFAWGVLLNLMITWFGDRLKSTAVAVGSFAAGLILFIALIYLESHDPGYLFHKIFFNSLLPLAFALMLLGSYYVSFFKWKALRLVAYYSYNWYLWHNIFVFFFTRNFGDTTTGLVLYLLSTFGISVIFTILVEETLLGVRKKVIAKLFPKAPGYVSTS